MFGNPPSMDTGKKMDITRARQWFKDAVDARKKWDKEAVEDFEFITGKQWSSADIYAMEKDKKAIVTINKIHPLINILSGYQRQNRYDITFRPRTADDERFVELRVGMTKYVMDATEYARHESRVFRDAAICGIGWFEVGYRWDEESEDGEAFIKRQSPFSIYVDPEAREEFFTDAKYIIRARWVDKDELKQVYPDQAETIDANWKNYDEDESQTYTSMDRETLYYQRDTKKIRLVECWYKVKTREAFAVYQDGAKKKFDGDLTGVVDMKHILTTQVRVCVFFDNVELEDMPSPYKHGEFPFIPYVATHYGEGDVPAGFVRLLKDPQREINKRRSQNIRILDTFANAGWMYEEEAMTAEQERNLDKFGSRPGVKVKLRAGGLGKIKEKNPAPPAAALIQAGTQAEADLPAISGINEGLLGTDIPKDASGRAIELRQRQAVTHLGVVFDNLKWTKTHIARLLWGKRNKPGIIPQFYTEQKVYRITGENGEYKDIVANQQKVLQDPVTFQTIQITLNDLSQGEFDIVIDDVQSSATQRMAQFWSLTDAVSKLGLPGDMVFDILIDLSELPKKEEIKKRFVERMKQQQMQLAMKEQARQEERINQNIAYKDAPLPIQAAMAARAKLLPPEIANLVMEWAAQTYLPPQLYAQFKQAQQQRLQQQQLQQLQQAQQPQTQGLPQGQQRASPMTKPALDSVMAGQMPAI